MRSLLALPLLLGAFAGTPSGPVNLFSPDGHDPRRAQAQVGAGKAYAPIGQLITRDDLAFQSGAEIKTGRLSTTATLVSPCYALATAHGVFGSAASTNFQDLRFRSISDDGKGFVETEAWPVAWGGTRKFADDWALIHLTRCEGRRLGWMKLSLATFAQLNNKTVETAGFPGDKPLALWRHAPCKLMGFEVALGLLSTDCAARPGASGAPILLRDRDGPPEIVGMIVQETNTKTDVLRQFDRMHANLAVYTPGVWANIRSFIEADLKSAGR
jgi:V8-like Glu-specific endopeptidase